MLRLAADSAVDLDDFADRAGAPGDAGVQRAQGELEAARVQLRELEDEAVEAAATLVDLDDVAGGDALGGGAASRGRGRRQRQEGGLVDVGRHGWWARAARWGCGRTPRRARGGGRSRCGRCGRR